MAEYGVWRVGGLTVQQSVSNPAQPTAGTFQEDNSSKNYYECSLHDICERKQTLVIKNSRQTAQDWTNLSCNSFIRMIYSKGFQISNKQGLHQIFTKYG